MKKIETILKYKSKINSYSINWDSSYKKLLLRISGLQVEATKANNKKVIKDVRKTSYSDYKINDTFVQWFSTSDKNRNWKNLFIKEFEDELTNIILN